MMPERYVLCRPVGGLNDSLNQIELCWRYCVSFNRILILDSIYSGFLDRWDRYFVAECDKIHRIIIYSDLIAARINQMTCLPSCVAGNLAGYLPSAAEGKGCVESVTGAILSFDMLREHPEQILLHHQYGGGILSFNCISHFVLHPSIARVVRDLRVAHPSYVAVHIRNTDYQTDYENVLLGLLSVEKGNQILLCSDDSRCKEYARKLFGDQVFFCTDTPETGGLSLHANASLNRLVENTNSLVDLAMLALGDRIYVSKTNQGVYSGFSMLANFLHYNKAEMGRFLCL